MALTLIKRLSSGTSPYIYLAILLITLAYFLTQVTQDSSRLNELLFVIFGIAILAVLLLLAILIRSSYKLYRDYNDKVEGSRLTIRLVSLFVLLIMVSNITIYGFSVHFLYRGINSWFDVQVEQALNDALELGRNSLGIRMRTMLRQTRMMAGVLSEFPDNELIHKVQELNKLSGALELSIWNQNGELVTSSSEDSSITIPDRPNETIFNQIKQTQDYISIEPGENGALQLQSAATLSNQSVNQDDRFLFVIFPINKNLSTLGKTVQDAYTQYKELKYLRKPLITLFILTLSLIVLLTVLASIWFAIWTSRRIVEPLQNLSKGTQAVAAGNYDTQLNVVGVGEIGFLVRSFNQMIQRLTHARNATKATHQKLAQQSEYLATVLGSLSSGVITIDDQHRIKTINKAASKILNVELTKHIDASFNELGVKQPKLLSLSSLVSSHCDHHDDWHQQIDIQQKKGLQTLICHGIPLPDSAGYVIVFDDVTTLLQAQRNAAWGEVAKRLAHEIKNPLTPIQLSAERLQHKFVPLLPQTETDTLTKLTTTIIQQVEAMKGMVNDFSDYARSPGLKLAPQDIGVLIKEIITLYQSNESHHFKVIDPPNPILINLDASRFRQVMHNLLKNAIEASEEANLAVDIRLGFHTIIQDDSPFLEIIVRDHGPGIPTTMIKTLFEPYITNKKKGTGLGLAIVKKIIEEHRGFVWAENTLDSGTSIIMRLPLENR